MTLLSRRTAAAAPLLSLIIWAGSLSALANDDTTADQASQQQPQIQRQVQEQVQGQQDQSSAADAQQPPDHQQASQPQSNSAAAPQTNSAPQRPSPSQPMSAEEKSAQQQRETSTSRDRLLFVLPNFLTIDDIGKVPPMTAAQKFKTQARSSFDWSKIPWYTFLAGVSQATNTHPELGQGGAGYGKRLAMTAADNTIENFFTSAIMPSILHQDPRFYQKNSGSVLTRALYPVEHIFVTRGDSGRGEFNFSEILGAGIGAAISTLSYHPRGERNFANVGQTWGTEIAYDTVSFEAKEFWPYLRRAIKKKKGEAAPAQGATAIP